MREIKFRAWNGERMLIMAHGEGDFYIQQGKVWEYDSCGYDSYEKEYPLMQYTGLTDKNGKEIYEDDVVKVEYDLNGVVTWNNRSSKYIFKFPNAHSEEVDLWLMELCEVIGNIYENPELLESD
jgi:uncharacterized phage protein (TIGR01671 family)